MGPETPAQGLAGLRDGSQSSADSRVEICIWPPLSVMRENRVYVIDVPRTEHHPDKPIGKYGRLR